jgi:hypothetical protein
MELLSSFQRLVGESESNQQTTISDAEDDGRRIREARRLEEVLACMSACHGAPSSPLSGQCA